MDPEFFRRPDVIVALLLLLIGAGAVLWYVVRFSRLAYMGARLCQLCGSEERAARLLLDIEQQADTQMRAALWAWVWAGRPKWRRNVGKTL
jgi:hypothetical protein